jgi:hypothetical protein
VTYILLAKNIKFTKNVIELKMYKFKTFLSGWEYPSIDRSIYLWNQRLLLFYFCLFVNTQFKTLFFLFLIATFDSSSRIIDVCANRQFLEGRITLYHVLTIFPFPFELGFIFIFSCLWVILTTFFVMLLLVFFAFISSHKTALLLYHSFPFVNIRTANFLRTHLQIAVSSC